MTLNLMIPQQTHTDFTPRIAVIGVGGGGTNAVDNMIALELKGVEFIVANTDAQQLMQSRADRRIQLGPHITQGLGAGAKPEIGRAAAEEAADELVRHLDGTHMVFVTAGMGGGTGTGAAPVIARMARERNILTVGVVTKPFAFEGGRRARAAELGIEELQHYVDTLIVIPNQNLFRMANEKTTWKEAFKMADNVLYMGVRGVTDLMIAPGLVNLDFADIRTVMAEMGKAMMGTGESEGENRAIRAAEAAISNPLLEDTSMSGARGLLINITGGDDMTLFEVDQAANRIREEVDEEANIIFGSAIDQNMSGRLRVSVVATGIDKPNVDAQRPRLVAVGGGAPVPVQSPAAAPVHQSGHLPVIANVVQGPVGAPVLAPVVVHTAGQQPIPLHLRPAERPKVGEEARADAANPALHAVAHASSIGSNTAPRPRASGLFAEPPAAAVVGSGAGSADSPRRASIFREVTGRIRQSLTGPTQAAPMSGAPQRTEPQFADTRAEPVRPMVRQSGVEDVALDIPAFLRRQSS